MIGSLDAVAQPCQKDFKSYLEASFVCIPGTYRFHTIFTAPNRCLSVHWGVVKRVCVCVDKGSVDKGGVVKGVYGEGGAW